MLAVVSGVRAAPIGVVLAGGAGRRMGGAKATVELAERPLAAWVLAALGAAVDEVAVVAKRESELPRLSREVRVWREPDEPRHPLAGVAEALRRAGGRPVLTCPLDLPFLGADALRGLLAALGELAVIAGQPLVGRFGPGALPALETAVAGGHSARETVAGLEPVLVEVPAWRLFNVNTPEDLARAEAMVAEGAGR